MSVECHGPWGDVDPTQEALDGLAALAAEVICEIVADACTHLEKLGYEHIAYHDSDDYLDDLFDQEGAYIEV